MTQLDHVPGQCPARQHLFFPRLVEIPQPQEILAADAGLENERVFIRASPRLVGMVHGEGQLAEAHALASP